MASDLAIIKSALVRLGAKPIDSMEEESSTGIIIRTVYPDLKRSILTMYPWRFSMTKRQLGLVIAEPLNEYRYTFQLPSDRLAGPYGAFSSGRIGVPPLRRYEIFSDKLFADQPEIWIDYQYEPPSSRWPAYFVELVTLALAGEVANAVTDISAKAELYHLKAWGQPSEQMRGGQFRIATSRDSQQQPPQVIEDFALIEARFS